MSPENYSGTQDFDAVVCDDPQQDSSFREVRRRNTD